MVAAKKIKIHYFAALREARGVEEEEFVSESETLKELYKEIQKQYNFQWGIDLLKVSLNATFVDWDMPFKDRDEVVFIPPVSGG